MKTLAQTILKTPSDGNLDQSTYGLAPVLAWEKSRWQRSYLRMAKSLQTRKLLYALIINP